ncbi:hypothetical protein EBR57_09225, partial [bacterium]|nr:hypothetical protein [bacterium]
QPDGSFLLTPQQNNLRTFTTMPIIEASADGKQAIGVYAKAVPDPPPEYAAPPPPPPPPDCPLMPAEPAEGNCAAAAPDAPEAGISKRTTAPIFSMELMSGSCTRLVNVFRMKYLFTPEAVAPRASMLIVPFITQFPVQ